MGQEPDRHHNTNRFGSIEDGMMKLSEHCTILTHQQIVQLQRMHGQLATLLSQQETVVAMLRGMQLQLSLYTEQLVQVSRSQDEKP